MFYSISVLRLFVENEMMGKGIGSVKKGRIIRKKHIEAARVHSHWTWLLVQGIIIIFSFAGFILLAIFIQIWNGNQSGKLWKEATWIRCLETHMNLFLFCDQQHNHKHKTHKHKEGLKFGKKLCCIPSRDVRIKSGHNFATTGKVWSHLRPY